MSFAVAPDIRLARKEQFLLAAHRLGLSRLRQDPERAFELLATLHRWRIQRGLPPRDPYMAEWETLLNSSIDSLEAAVCAETDRASELRRRSPFGSLMTEAERQALLRETRVIGADLPTQMR
jgi:hypothetical protein